MIKESVSTVDFMYTTKLALRKFGKVGLRIINLDLTEGELNLA